MPHYLKYEEGQYRRLNRKTPNREVATLFGKITFWRHGYRYVQRDVAEPAIFPLEMQLGLMEGATPALAVKMAHFLIAAHTIKPHEPWPKRAPRNRPCWSG